MQLSDFDFSLPQELIAQEPSAIRGEDRLMTLDRATGKTSDRTMHDLPSLLPKGALVVFNNSRVRKARVFGTKQGGAAHPTEFVFLQEEAGEWVAIVHGGKHCRVGNIYDFPSGRIATITASKDGGVRYLRFSPQIDEGWFLENGHVPLPPYIKRGDNPLDSERYQTVYAQEVGSAAAPTAGLHFTSSMMACLKGGGFSLEFITLHVGLGTFAPVRESNIEDHNMHTEVYSISEQAAAKINDAKARGVPIVAVGTTVMRTLEASAQKDGTIHVGTNATNIFIYPPYDFKVVDALFTNFHTPESTLLMLVSAFAGRENILAAYRDAVKKQYHFFSYGDAMLIY